MYRKGDDGYIASQPLHRPTFFIKDRDKLEVMFENTAQVQIQL